MKKLMVISALSLFFVTSCSSVKKNPDDPYESFNRTTFKVNDTLDKTLLKPAAIVYDKTLPKIARKGVSNVFRNLGDVNIIANNLLQLKFNEAAKTTHRFAFNSTFGLLGVLNLTDSFKLAPYKTNDFGMTLAHYGWKDTHFLVIPFLGPSTMRDSIGRGVEYTEIFTRPGKIFADSRYATALKVVNTRADLLNLEKIADSASFDPYIFQKDAYLQIRKNQLRKAGILAEEDDNEGLSVEDILKESGGENNTD